MRTNVAPATKISQHVTFQGYIAVHVWDGHPYYPYARQRKSRSTRYREGLMHRLVMSESLGRRLKPQETVHHIDGDRSNNTLSNLQIRHGAHGKGARLYCAECGSHNITSGEL